MPDDSGADKNTLLIRLNDLGDYAVGVKVSTKDKRTSFQKFLHLSAEGVSPKAVFYADDPLEGPFYGKALGGKISLKTKDINIRAEPYFFNQENGKAVLQMEHERQKRQVRQKTEHHFFGVGGGSPGPRISFEMEKRGGKQPADGGNPTNIAF